MPLDKAKRLLDRLRIMLLVSVRIPFLSETSNASYANTRLADRVTGAIGSAVSGIVGNKEAQSRSLELYSISRIWANMLAADFSNQHDKGKTSQRGVEADLQRQAPN